MSPDDLDRIARIDWTMYRQADADAPTWEGLSEAGRETQRASVRSVLNAARAIGLSVVRLPNL